MRLRAAPSCTHAHDKLEEITLDKETSHYKHAGLSIKFG